MQVSPNRAPACLIPASVLYINALNPINPYFFKAIHDLSYPVPGCPPSNLPAWLQYLLACSCLLTHRHAQFQLQCVSTLLEIVGLLQSTMSVTKARRRSKGQAHSTAPAAATAFSSPSVGSTSGEASYAIVMMPLIKEQHYQCVVKQTVVPQVRVL